MLPWDDYAMSRCRRLQAAPTEGVLEQPALVDASEANPADTPQQPSGTPSATPGSPQAQGRDRRRRGACQAFTGQRPSRTWPALHEH